MSDNKYHIYKPGDIIQWEWQDGYSLAPVLVLGYAYGIYYRALNLNTGMINDTWEFGNTGGRWVQLA